MLKLIWSDKFIETTLCAIYVHGKTQHRRNHTETRGIEGKGLVHSMRLVKPNQSSLKMLSKEKKSYDTELIYSGVIGIQTK